MKQFKNLLCILLAVLMLCSAVGISVSATETEKTEETIASANASETTDLSEPDCDSKPIVPETSDPTVTTDPEEPDCDSKPIPPSVTSDPTETTEPEDSIPLTGPDGTAPTDPSETTNPTVTESVPDSTETTTVPLTSTSQTEPIETTVPTESAVQTDPTEATEPDTTPKLNKKNLKLDSGEVFNLKVKNSNGERARYTCSDIKIVIVSSSGKVTALKKGSAKITVKMGKKKFICKVTVKNNPKLKISGKTITEIKVKKGERVKINLVGKAENINNVYYNTQIAKFDSGLPARKLRVKGLKKGTTTLKIKVNYSKIIKLKVKVK